MCAVTAPATLDLGVDGRAPQRARRFVEELCSGPRFADAVLVAVQLVSEVVTNAFQHGRVPVVLDVECDEASGICVRVWEGGRSRPIPRPHNPWADTGRGVHLLDMLSDSWGVEPDDNGKTVWFHVRPRMLTD